MDFSVLLWFFLFVVAAVVAVKVAVKVSKAVLSVVSVVIIVLVVFGFLVYSDVIDIDKFGLKDQAKSALSEGKDKVTGYAVEKGKELLDFEEEKEGDS